jgi:hypothetical protein
VIWRPDTTMVTSTGPHRVCATEPWYVAAAPEVPVAVVVAVGAVVPEPVGAAVVVAEPASVELVGAVLAVPPLVIIVRVGVGVGLWPVPLGSAGAVAPAAGVAPIVVARYLHRSTAVALACPPR